MNGFRPPPHGVTQNEEDAMTAEHDIEVRRMKRQEMDLAVEWAAQEGWNPGLGDAESFFQTDPHGFFMATLEQQPVGCISAVAYDYLFGFIGFFIVKPQFRGHRIGVELGKAALEYLGNRNIGVDGVEGKIKNYETFGFRLAYHNIRYEGLCQVKGRAEGLVPASQIPLRHLEAYDRRFFPAARPSFLASWLAQPNATALASQEGERLTGYGMIRPCRTGCKIGPLFADTPEIATRLLAALASHGQAGSPFYLDIPGINPDAERLARSWNMKPVFKTARMYNQQAPALPVQNIYGVTSFELG